MANKKILIHFKDSLQVEGLKFTSQRVAVLEEIIKNIGRRECEEIYFAIKEQGKQVSRATVYRTINILVKNNFARKIELGDGRARYESKVNSPHHDHLICTSCGNVVEFMDQNIEDIQEKIAKRYNFTLNRHTHQLFGTCKKCQ